MRTLTLLMVFFTTFSLFAKSPDIDNYLEKVANGQLKQVKSELPDLLVEYPDNPGVKLLLAVVIDDAYKALDIYKKIVSEYPDSKWADDAYWRIVQFYAVKGDSKMAKNELSYFRSKYPNSPYIIPAAEVVRISEGIARSTDKAVNIKDKEAIGRKNNKIQLRTEKPDNPENNRMQDFSDKKKDKKIGMKVQTDEKQETEAAVMKDSVEENSKKLNEPVNKDPVLEKNITNNTDSNKPKAVQEKVDEKPVELAVNERHHKVIRKKAEEDEEDDNPVKNVLKQQQERVNKVSKDRADAKPETEDSKPEIAEEKNDVEKAGYYGLQVGLFESKDSADDQKEKFLNKRIETKVEEKQHNKKNMYAVIVGNYSSLQSANAAKIIVEQQCNCEPVVFEK